MCDLTMMEHMFSMWNGHNKAIILEPFTFTFHRHSIAHKNKLVYIMSSYKHSHFIVILSLINLLILYIFILTITDELH